MQTKTAREIHGYWNRLRAARPVPERCDIEPAEIGPILPDLFMLEHDAPAGLRFRLAGTRLCTRFDRELKGHDFAEIWSEETRSRIALTGETVIARQTPAVLLAAGYTARRERVLAEVVLLPLRSETGAVDRIIGALSPLAPRGPFELPFTHMTLEMADFIDLDRHDTDQGGGYPQAGSGAAAPAAIAVRSTGLGETVRRVLHLRIFEGGRHGR
ncbi:MAG: PAS domain-containing protein [Shinella sp.]|nr:PAS domain-containing protein [Shinella sp.]